MADFISQFTGTQIDNGIDRALNPDATPTQGSDALVESGGVFAAINTAALSSAPAILNTASGAVCSFADGSASPMTSVVAEIVANQAGSGDPAPDNIRPISGYTGASITRAGRNILAPKYSGRTNNYVTFTVNGNEIKAQGTATSNAFAAPNYTSTPSMMTLLPAGTYFISSNEGISGARVYLTGIYTDGDAFPAGAASGTGEYYILTKPAYVYPNLRITNGTTIDHTFKIQVEVGNEAHDYEPYAGEVFSVSWQDAAGTVYGGTVDLVSGVLTVTHKRVNLGDLTWGYQTGQTHIFQTGDLGALIEKPSANSVPTTAICDHYAAYSYSGIAGQNNHFAVSILGTIRLNDSAYDNDLANFQTDMDGVYMVYPLATAETYQLTPQEVESLLGNNNIWADTGDIASAEYRADTKLYIQSLLGA